MDTAVVLRGKDDLRLEEVEIPKIKDGEVLVKVNFVGVCGTDVHFWKRGYLGLPQFPIDDGYILGHETSATVVQVAADVTCLTVGDRVHLHPAVPCGQCPQCHRGKGNICVTKRKVKGSTNGHLRGHVAHRATHCYKLPESVSLEEGALVEPFAVAVHASDRAEVKPGSCVLITGSGGIGLLTVVAVKAAGASSIIVTDLSKAKLDIARSFGATHVTQVTSRDPQEVANQVIAMLGRKPDCSIDCSGTEPGIATGILSCTAGGIAAFAGLAPPSCTLPLGWAAINEIDLRPVMRYGTCYDRAFNLIASGQVNLKPLVTHKFPLVETEKAFNLTLDPAGNTIKVLIDCSN